MKGGGGREGNALQQLKMVYDELKNPKAPPQKQQRPCLGRRRFSMPPALGSGGGAAAARPPRLRRITGTFPCWVSPARPDLAGQPWQRVSRARPEAGLAGEGGRRRWCPGWREGTALLGGPGGEAGRGGAAGRGGRRREGDAGSRVAGEPGLGGFVLPLRWGKGVFFHEQSASPATAVLAASRPAGSSYGSVGAVRPAEWRLRSPRGCGGREGCQAGGGWWPGSRTALSQDPRAAPSWLRVAAVPGWSSADSSSYGLGRQGGLPPGGGKAFWLRFVKGSFSGIPTQLRAGFCCAGIAVRGSWLRCG